MIVRLGLLDRDERYLNKIAAYISAHADEAMRLELCLFASLEECNAYLSTNSRLDILLATPELLPDPTALVRKPILAYLSDDKTMTAWADHPAICKYQKASLFLRSIQGLAAGIHNAGGSYTLGGSGTALLFIGACGGVGCSTAAMACAVHQAAKGKRVVYFSLQQNAMPELFFGEQGKSMSDVHYAYQEWQRIPTQENGSENIRSLQLKLKSLLVTDAHTGVDYFTSFTLPVDAMDFTGSEAADLVNVLAAQYDYCIVDADSQLNEMLMQVLPCVQWMTVVSDGTPKCNLAMSRMLESLKVLQGSQEAKMNCEVAVLYNQFGSRARNAEKIPDYVKKLGEIPRYGNALQKDIVAEIAKGNSFDELEK
ncbi:hypothetical protein [uncultured Gemmiger sp.]|uniref:hypothetical protein n=1 Tax=uncultured Gemmiger sp. TaxID=1623490 RepID=UPI0025CF26DF|nr:hypothetical protein [uncultured Gemmiger sp.]